MIDITLDEEIVFKHMSFMAFIFLRHCHEIADNPFPSGWGKARQDIPAFPLIKKSLWIECVASKVLDEAKAAYREARNETNEQYDFDLGDIIPAEPMRLYSY